MHRRVLSMETTKQKKESTIEKMSTFIQHSKSYSYCIFPSHTINTVDFPYWGAIIILAIHYLYRLVWQGFWDARATHLVYLPYWGMSVRTDICNPIRVIWKSFWYACAIHLTTFPYWYMSIRTVIRHSLEGFMLCPRYRYLIIVSYWWMYILVPVTFWFEQIA